MSALHGAVVPEVQGLVEVLFRRRLPRRVHFMELFIDAEVKEALARRFGIGGRINPGDPLREVKRDTELHAFLGYEVFRVALSHKADVFETRSTSACDTTALAGQRRTQRSWQEEHTGPIQGWKEFDRYRWPSVSDIDFSALEWAEKNLPPGMGCYDLTAHIFETLSFLMGYESLCYAISDAPDLVQAICEKVGTFYVEHARALADFSCTAVIWGSDDLGFRSSTMVSPEFLRAHILPWHARCAQIAHAKGKPYLLHSCGNLEAIMDDLVSAVKIDGKHSFEDAILPVTEAKRRYGDKVSILGGVDVDFLCRAGEEAIRRRVRETLDACMPGGGYCLGTGNTVANYIPVDNYLAMLDEGRRYAV